MVFPQGTSGNAGQGVSCVPFYFLWESINKGIRGIVKEAHLFPRCEDDPEN
jgi:hypothetical protein